MQVEKAETFSVTSIESLHQQQKILANYEFRQGKKFLFHGTSAQARFVIALAEFVRCRDRRMETVMVDYEGEKDLFRVEMKLNKK